MNAFVITMNDSVEHVHIGTYVDAIQKMDQMRRAYYDRQHLKHNYGDSSVFAHMGLTEYDRYCKHVHWNVRETTLTIKVGA